MLNKEEIKPATGSKPRWSKGMEGMEKQFLKRLYEKPGSKQGHSDSGTFQSRSLDEGPAGISLAFSKIEPHHKVAGKEEWGHLK